ncbi:MAG TPA: hypothetical protein VFI12_08240, partial [Thermomicrobiales bacterium]|nr:hypothetical protein [Thermomicrobiales bacterium]
ARTDIPIILIAGSPNEISAEHAIHIGADDVTYAPIEMEELAVALFSRIREWRAQRPDRPWADQLAQRKSQ